MQRSSSRRNVVTLVIAALLVALLPSVAAATVVNPSPDPGGLWTPSPGTTPASGTYIHLESVAGDLIGEGRWMTYTKADANLIVSENAGAVSIDVDGNEEWYAQFRGPATVDPLQVGFYSDLTRYGPDDRSIGGLSWFGEGNSCSTLEGWFVVDEVTYLAGLLDSLTLRFEQRCEGGPPLHGIVVYDADDPTTPPGPIQPVPADLWQPAAGTTPASGTFAYVKGADADPVTDGVDRLFTKADAEFKAINSSGLLAIDVTGDERWSFDFEAMEQLATMQPGFYPDVHRRRFGSPVKGSIEVSGPTDSCYSLDGWFAIDELVMASGQIDRLTVRFEQSCEGMPAAHGMIVIDADDPTMPPGPVQPPPPDLWAPAPGTTPASGTYTYIDGEAGDTISRGTDRLFTNADSVSTVTNVNGNIRLVVEGDERWQLDFKAMTFIGAMQLGYYPDLLETGRNNPTRGGMDYSGPSNSCSTLTGWFVVDQLVMAGSAVEQLHLRFAMWCNGGPGMHGVVAFDANDPTVPPGPVQPPPPNLWTSAPGSVPATGTYVAIDGEAGDPISGGEDHLYTNADAPISATHANGTITVRVDGDEDWVFNFEPMDITGGVMALGWYPDLQRFSSHNETKGGLSWSGESRSCSRLDGWFVVDELVLAGNAIDQLDLRFEQACDGYPASHGQISFDRSDPSTPPGPINPRPPGLWRPDPALLPTSGSFVLLESTAGDYIGRGETSLLQPATDTIAVDLIGNQLEVDVGGSGGWSSTFAGMSSITSLQEGYYGGLLRYPFHNTARGGLNWSGYGRGCGSLYGWFDVQDLTRVNGVLTSITLRFEQRCGSETAPPLHGLIHWENGGGTGTMCGATYPDVTEASPFCGPIGWATLGRLTNGYADGGFHPGASISRRAVVAMLYRYAGSPTGPFPIASFTDVPPSDPFQTAIRWAAAEGIVGGYPDGTFRGSAPVSRQATVAMMHRLAGEPAGPFPDPLFTDVAADSPFKEQISWAAMAGITTGYAGGTFHPVDAVTRQAFVAYLHRLDGVI